MAVTKLTNSGIKTGQLKYDSFLAGNDAYNPGNFESIATVTVGAGGQSTVTFSSIPSTYTHLQLRFSQRPTAGDNVAIRFNSDSGNNYVGHKLNGDGTSASAGYYSAQSFMYIGGAVPGDGANIYGPNILDILDYGSTNKYKTARNLNGWQYATGGQVNMFSVLWMSTSAINSITLYQAGGANFDQYSHFALYGIKGA